MRFPDSDAPAAILEAARLVAAGRAAEATTVLQGSLGIAPLEAPTQPRSWTSLHDWLERLSPWTRAKSAPPGAAPECRRTGGQFLLRSYQGIMGSRAYRLYVPSGYRGEPVPIVVMLHGCKQDAADFAAGTRMNVHAEELTWLAVYPEQPARANGSRCWNWFRPEDQERDRGEPALIAGITREVMNDFAADPARVYVAGLSAGGAAAAIMGFNYADVFAAVAIHSGLATGAAQDVISAFAVMRSGSCGRHVTGGTPPVPTIIFHGDRDKTVHPKNAELIITQLGAGLGLKKHVEKGQVPGGCAYTRTCYTDCRGSILLELWLLHGAAHAWSGGSRSGSYTDPHGPDATREMLRFFRRHSRPGIDDRVLRLSDARPGSTQQRTGSPPTHGRLRRVSPQGTVNAIVRKGSAKPTVN
jgi:poly(hydroxyalkanoate) depolymerase family esterase